MHILSSRHTLRVVFQSSSGVLMDIGFADSRDQAWKLVNSFLSDHNYSAPCFRISLHEKERYLWIDCWSHSEFFMFCDLTDADIKQFTLEMGVNYEI